MAGDYGKVTLSGTSVGTEVWSTSFALASDLPPGGWDQGIGDAQAAAIGAVPIPAGLKALMSTKLALTTVRWEQRDGSTGALHGVSIFSLSTPVPGSSSLAQSPQVACTLSLRTNTPGPRGRGRMFWPAVGATLDGTTGRLFNPTNTTVATDAKTYLTSIASAITAVSGSPFVSLYPVVFSKADHSVHKVTKLQVGNVLDVQRRRRDALPEAYATVAIP